MTMRVCRLILLAGLLPASASGFEPNVRPTLEVPRITSAIVIDGDLSDPAWSQAARATNWTETSPGDQVEPPVSSETWVAYDADHLYLAFVAEDDPTKVRATLRDRDQIWQDDYMGMILDTYGTAAWAYELFVNPLGIQGDLRWTTQGEDLRFDMVWETEGRITETGWQVEVAIPFKSLRFPEGGIQNWRATFWRNRPRESRARHSWARMDRDDPCWPCNFGTLTGMSDIASSSAWELLPSLVAYDAAALSDPDNPDSGLKSVDSKIDFGLGARYALTSSISAEATFNPDFSQVEGDAAQIDVNTTFALFFDERRPFFQEGSDLYSTWVSQVYTRSINNPQWAGKLTGRQGRSSFAFLTAQDEDSPIILPFAERSVFRLGGRSWSNVVRARRNFGEDNHLGVLATDRRLEGGGSGSTYSVDAQMRLLTNYRFEAQVTGSHTEEPDAPGPTEGLEDLTFADGDHTAVFDGEVYDGHAEYISLERSARLWNFDLDYWAYSPSFRADNGFVTQNDLRRGTFFTGWYFQPNGRFVDQVSPRVNVGKLWNTAGIRKDEWFRPELSATLKGQTNLSIAWLASEERFREEEFKGIRRWSFNANTEFSQLVIGGAYYEFGKSIARNEDDPILGDAQNLSLWTSIKPMQRFVIEPTFDYAKLNRGDGSNLFEGYVLRSRFSYQFSRALFARLVLQYNEFSERVDVDPLVTYRVNPFTVFFVGSRHLLERPGDTMDTRQTERQIFAKFQYLFRT